ncbi:Actin cross-linking toxin VgrG1 [Klebsiella oxytoca]|uniref:type VI secretion system Vgr family protein n=1 Tax=Klebsiella grimontii TaxID=2058152 RepID=UPI0012B8F169|nr:Actin cross-linking toxin VgrG1 [Klebsiella oxytoca]CAH5713551.1 Actin cross-linking toxin VgrG1 [Klebsiella oxytoca]
MIESLSSLVHKAMDEALGLSRYRVDVHDCSHFLDVLRYNAVESLSQPWRYDVAVTCSSADIACDTLLLKPASFTFQTPVFDGTPALPVRTVFGVVESFRRVSTSNDDTHYALTIVPRIALLGYTKGSEIYLNQSVIEVVEQVLRKHGLEGPDFEFRLSREYPSRELITQWRETDLKFIQRLLAEVGIYWRYEMDSRLEQDVVIFQDSQQQYEFGVTLPLRNPAGMSDSGQESIWDIQTAYNVVSGSMANAGEDFSVGVMGNATLLTGEKLGLFARTGQLSQKSGEGPIDVQAQNASMRLFAEKKLTLSSASDISFAGKKRITLIGGGSYLRLEAGKVEYGTTATYMRKVKRTMAAGAASMPLNLPVMPLVDLFTSQPISQNLKPVLRLSDAPGVNGLAQSVRQWQIVEADSYMQAITTDEVLMNGQTDDAGNVLQSETQQAQLIKLASQYSSRLWMVAGDRAHRLYFNMIPADTGSDAKDFCAQDAMGFHRMFNSVSDNIQPGEKLKQCIQDEQQINGAILDSLREEK